MNPVPAGESPVQLWSSEVEGGHMTLMDTKRKPPGVGREAEVRS
jgi:hypothetical protein